MIPKCKKIEKEIKNLENSKQDKIPEAINYFSSNCYDNTKIEINSTNMQQIILRDNLVIINLTFLLQDSNGLGSDYSNLITLPQEVRPSKNFCASIISPSANVVGFGYYQAATGYIRIKMFSKITKGDEISIKAMYYKE